MNLLQVLYKLTPDMIYGSGTNTSALLDSLRSVLPIGTNDSRITATAEALINVIILCLHASAFRLSERLSASEASTQMDAIADGFMTTRVTDETSKGMTGGGKRRRHPRTRTTKILYRK